VTDLERVLLEALREVPAWFAEWNIVIGPAEETLLDRVNAAIAEAGNVEGVRRRVASKAGLARAGSLTAQQRSAIAGKAGSARMKKLTPAQRSEIGRGLVRARRTKRAKS
jgi:hypothetical protein